MYVFVLFINIFLNFIFIFMSGCKNDIVYLNFFIVENICFIIEK